MKSTITRIEHTGHRVKRDERRIEGETGRKKERERERERERG